MKIVRYGLLLLASLSLFSGCESSVSELAYPETRTVDQVDLLHGVSVPDPYRWLEDLDSDETKRWIEAQNSVSSTYLGHLPNREEIRNRLTELWDYEKFGVPEKRGNRYFFKYNSGLENQDKLYMLESLTGEPVMILDPNVLSDDGTVALADFKVCPDGRLIAYGLAEAGSDWQQWKVRDLNSGKDLDDLIDRVKFSLTSWAADGSGFFYSRYDQSPDSESFATSNVNQKLYFHEIGTPQSSDRLLYERPDKEKWLLRGKATEDGSFLLINVLEGSSSNNGIFYKDLSKEDSQVVELLGQFDARYVYVGNQGSRFWFRTTFNSPLSSIVEINIESPQRDQWKTIVPESADTLQEADLLNQQFVCRYLEDASSRVRIYSLEGQFLRELDLPGIGSVTDIKGGSEDTEAFYGFTSFNSPTLTYRCDLETGDCSSFRDVNLGFDPNDFETSQHFFESKDGTRVPMFISHRKGLERDERTPTILYGYGGFNIPRVPRFSVSNLVWMEMGGIFVSANLRGGGEYGEEWHQAGTKLTKQNVFDDFISAAEYLIKKGFTSSPALAIEGGSNGGLLVGACLNQRPDLFGAAVPHVGVMDMLRFHKFTIGWAWVSDYGSPDNPEEFEALYAYSPYHNIRKNISYPATLILTADHDDRVVPSHSFKYAARLQKAQSGPEPILIRIETRAGHGAGKPASKRIESATDKLVFLMNELG